MKFACIRFDKALRHDFIERWIGLIDSAYVGARAENRDDRCFSTRSSSIRLLCIPELVWDEIIPHLRACGILSRAMEAFGDSVVFDLDECWARRQYAPHNYPRLHAPHTWHQDGALRFDFKSPDDGILEMLTCWIALTACGSNAPGLELVTDRLSALLPPSGLTDNRIRSRFHSDAFTRPELQPGDALVFPGDILHRTHVTAEMTADRTSIELRLFPATRIPSRLRGDRFVPAT